LSGGMQGRQGAGSVCGVGDDTEEGVMIDALQWAGKQASRQAGKQAGT